MKGVNLMDEGYIKLFRKMISWEWYTDTSVKTLFIHCLIKANYMDKNWKGITIKRGQFITSIRHLAKECGLSVKQTRRAISALSGTHEIEYKGYNKYSVITVVEYDSYQTKGTIEGTKEDKQRANKGQQHKNIKNIKNKRKENTPDLKNPWIGIADDGEEYFIDKQKYEEWNNEHGIVEE